MLAIIGCPRSGTRYISEALRSAGVDVGHESMGRDGTADWRLVVGELKGYDVVAHQARNPLRVVPSLMTIFPQSWEFIERHMPCRPKVGDPWFVYPARVWLEWNRLAAKAASFTYRVEDLEAITGRVLPAALRREPTPEEKARVLDTPRDVNSRPHPESTWWDILGADARLFDEMAELCAELGYEGPSQGA